MITQAEIGLVEADERIAAAENNIRQLGSLIPELASSGYATEEIAGQVEQMRQVLDYLHAQRRSIVQTLDGVQTPPRILQKTARRSSSWREICNRLSGRS
jgi:hypothetical protein